jgi:hypothetical protein
MQFDAPHPYEITASESPTLFPEVRPYVLPTHLFDFTFSNILILNYSYLLGLVCLKSTSATFRSETMTIRGS